MQQDFPLSRVGITANRLHQVQGAALLIDENLTTLEVNGVENVP